MLIGDLRLTETLPVFPIKDIIILPGGQIPIHIYEKKYINMVQDALASHDRLIGVVLQKNNILNKIGCATRITAFEETIDGSFLITLTGYIRFRLIEEIKTMRGYMRYMVGWQNFEKDLLIDPNPKIDREKLVNLLREYMSILKIKMDWSILSRTPNFNLITFFAMSLPFKNTSQQDLMEAASLEDRAGVLINMIESEIKILKDIDSKN